MTAVFAAWAAVLVGSARARLLTVDDGIDLVRGSCGRAVEAHLRAVALAETTFGDPHDAAVTAQALAVTFTRAGRFDDAEVLFRRALSITGTRGAR